MLPAIRLALLVALCSASDASAQAWDALGTQSAPRTLIVVDEDGNEVKGRLTLLTADDVTISVYGQEVTFPRSRTAAVYQAGDSAKNGALFGLAIGAGWGLLARPDLSCWNAQHTKSRQCTSKESLGFAVANSVIGAGIGAGIGALADKLIPGRRRVYRKP